MSSQLFRLATQTYPEAPVTGAILARHERAGAKWTLLLVVAVLPVFFVLGWPAWLSGAVGAGLASAGYSLRCDNYVLVLTAPRLRLHRPGRIWWFRVPLGPFDREVAIDDVRELRRGVFNDKWLVDGVKMHVDRTSSQQLRDVDGNGAITLRL